MISNGIRGDDWSSTLTFPLRLGNYLKGHLQEIDICLTSQEGGNCFCLRDGHPELVNQGAFEFGENVFAYDQLVFSQRYSSQSPRVAECRGQYVGV